MQNGSMLQLYSLGVVAKNKPLKTYEIEVVPIEDAPMLNGELNDHMTPYTAKSSNEEGAAYQVDVKVTASIKATWLPIGGSNRMTAPDVRRGEKIAIMRFGDVDKYWWITLTQQEELRRMETVTWAFSGTSDEKAKLDSTNMYYFEVSTHAGHVLLHTSKANGEPFSYDIALNTKLGNLMIKDDGGNYISLNSKERHLEMRNNDGSYMDINKKNVYIKATDTLTLDAPKIIDKSSTRTSTTTSRTETSSSINAVHASGNLKVNGISLPTHIHQEQGDLSPVGPPQ